MEHTSQFPDVDIQAVWQEITAPEFLMAFALEVGVEAEGIEQSREDDEHVAAMPWSFHTDRPGIPSLAQKLLPKRVKLDWRQRWAPVTGESAAGQVDVKLYGNPSANVVGQSSLAESAGGVTYVVLTQTKTSLRWPVAGKVEGMIDKDLVGWILSVQARVLRRRLGLPDEK